MLQFGIGILIIVILAALFLPVNQKTEKVAVKKTLDNTDAPLSEVLEYLEDVGYSDDAG